MTDISVIIPCFNAANTICEAIESIKASSHIRLQIIVIDDNSTDSTLSLANQYKMDHENLNIDILSNIYSKGVAGALNTGLKHATGDYIMRLDADDFFSPNTIDNAIKYMEINNSILIAGLAIKKTYICQENGLLEYEYQYYKDAPYEMLCSLGYMVRIGANCIFRRELIAQGVAYSETLKAEEELDFCIKSAKYGDLGFINDAIYIYNLRLGLGRSFKSKFRKKFIMIKLNFKAIYTFSLPLKFYLLSLMWLLYGILPEIIKSKIRPFLISSVTLKE